MKKLLLSLSIALIVACGGGGGNGGGGIIVGGSAPAAPPVTPPVVSTYVVMGDSMAVGLARIMPESECLGRTPFIETLLANADKRVLNNAVLWIGVNNITDDESQNIDELCVNYSKIVWSLKYTGRLFCVGVPKVQGYPLRWKNIELLNEHIKATCGADSYIDTWAMPLTFVDGLHPGDDSYQLVVDEIIARTNAK